MKYRHEWKHEINYLDMLTIRQRVTAVMQPDPHTIDGKYLIRSLYFDNLYDKALREKVDDLFLQFSLDPGKNSGSAIIILTRR